MAQVAKYSPNASPSLNSSFMMNASMANTPTSMNMSSKFRNQHRFSFSPMDLDVTAMKSPSISPIVKNDDLTPSPTSIKRREFKEVHKVDKNRRRTCFNIVMKNYKDSLDTSAADLDTTLSIRTILKNLKLLSLTPIFDREEINLAAFFTLTDGDLKTIGIDEKPARMKIIDFINDCDTPKNLQKIAVLNFMLRK